MDENVIIRPLNLVFVRHGESEANVVQNADKVGDRSGFTEEFRSKSNAQMALTSEGIEQARKAGDWIRGNISGGVFDAYYVSSYKRALQTAANLHLPEGEDKEIWKIRDYLREQSWGHLDNMPNSERWEKFPEIMALKERDREYWTGVGGESMANLVFRAKTGIISTLYREVPNGSGIVVSHGNTMWAIRIVMEGLTFEDFKQIDNKDNPLEKMNNCQIVQYTRVNPENPEDIRDNFSWMRTVCPWDLSLSKNEWQPMKRPKYTNAQLLRDI